MLHRILHRLARGALRRLVEQFIGDAVGVVLTRNGDAVADPLRYRILRKLCRPFLLARSAQRLEGIGPRLHTKTLHDADQPSAQQLPLTMILLQPMRAMSINAKSQEKLSLGSSCGIS